jgi:tRNA pseudouridine55 synthase
LTIKGILPIVKPAGMTSHDVVRFIRKALNIQRVGHTGTLDPDATGVLIILIGKATRLMQFMVNLPKAYVAEVVLGITTDTLDASGEILSEIKDVKIPKERFVEALSGFRGQIAQVPPMVSAVHYKGQRLYSLARRGIEVPREVRKVHIYELMVRKWPENDPLVSKDRVLISIRCSSGTYVRQLVSDIGDYLGCGAHVGLLCRTEVGDIDMASCHSLDEIKAAISDGSFCNKILPISTGLSHLPTVILDEYDHSVMKKLSTGARIHLGDLKSPIRNLHEEQVKEGDLIGVITSSGSTVCVVKVRTIQNTIYLQPFVVFV